jgi:hypothetical protein
MTRHHSFHSLTVSRTFGSEASMIARFRSQATINCAGQTAPTKSQLITISLATHFGTHARYRFVSQKIARRPAMAASGPPC